MIKFQDLFFMKRAIKCACKALDQNEWPVGAVIVKNKKVISTAYNMIETLQDPLAHAEILAAKRALKILNTKFLYDCVMFVNLEPCKMCFYTLSTLRISKIIYGCESFNNIYNKVEIISDIFDESSKKLLQLYGKQLRMKEKFSDANDIDCKI